MSRFSELFNLQKFPVPSDQDVQCLAQRVRDVIGFDVSDIEEILSGIEDVDRFNPMDDELIHGAFETITSDVVESYVEHSDAYAAVLSDAFALPMAKVVKDYHAYLLQTQSILTGKNNRPPSYEQLEERLTVLLDAASQKIAKSVVFITDCYEHNLFDVKEAEDEPLHVREKPVLADFIHPARLSPSEKDSHEYMVGLFYSYLTVDADEVMEFLEDETFVDDMFVGIFDLPEMDMALRDFTKTQKNQVEHSGRVCAGFLLDAYKQKYKEAVSGPSADGYADDIDMNVWARTITYSFQEVAVRMAQTCDMLRMGPCSPKPECS